MNIWLKDNRFKAGVLIGVAAIGSSIAWYFFYPLSNANPKVRSFKEILGIRSMPSIKADGPPWLFRFRKDNISVYTRKLNSALLEFKSDVIVSAPIDQVVAFYEDVKKTPQWYYECTRMEVIKDEGPLKKIFYFVMHPPWPVSERDAVFRRVKSIDPASGVVTFHLTALPEGFPQQKGKIRVPYLDIIFRFTPLEEGKTEMYFQQHGEAGGYIPAFIANALAVDTPLKSLHSFRELVEGNRSP